MTSLFTSYFNSHSMNNITKNEKNQLVRLVFLYDILLMNIKVILQVISYIVIIYLKLEIVNIHSEINKKSS